MSYEIPDPNALTIAKLKSILVQEGFGDQLPARAEKKDFYVDLYRKNIVPLLQARNAHSRTPGPRAASLATTTLASAQDRTAQTDFVNRRKTIHTLAPDDAAEPSKTTKPSKPAKPAQTGPSTPAPKSSSSSTAPRRLTFSPEASVPVPTAEEHVNDDHTTAAVAADARPSAPSSTSTTTTTSSSSSARRVTLPPGAISYPKLSTAPATPAPTSAAGASDLSPDLRRIIAAQRAHKKAGRGGAGGSSWVFMTLIALVVALVAAAAGLALAHQQGHQLPAGLADLAALLPLSASSLLSSNQPYFCDTSVHPYPGRATPPAGTTPSGGKCVDCPHYGVCKDGRLIKCMTGYVPSGGVRCVRDQDIARAIDLCREEAHQALAIRAGQVECGYDVAPLPMPELDLREILKQKTKEAGLFRPWDEAKFAEAFLELKRDLQRPPANSASATPARISVQVVGSNYTFTTSDSQLPWTCMARRAAWAHVHYIAGAVVVLLGALMLAVQQRRRAAREADIVSLVQRTKELLKQKKRRAPSSSGGHAWVPVIEIRDLLFHEDPDFAGRYGTIAEKLAVWAVAERRLRADTRIREYAQMVEQQQQLVWEYIGTVEEELAQNVLLSPRGSTTRKSVP